MTHGKRGAELKGVRGGFPKQIGSWESSFPLLGKIFLFIVTLNMTHKFQLQVFPVFTYIYSIYEEYAVM